MVGAGKRNQRDQRESRRTRKSTKSKKIEESEEIWEIKEIKEIKEIEETGEIERTKPTKRGRRTNRHKSEKRKTDKNETPRLSLTVRREAPRRTSGDACPPCGDQSCGDQAFVCPSCGAYPLWASSTWVCPEGSVRCGPYLWWLVLWGWALRFLPLGVCHVEHSQRGIPLGRTSVGWGRAGTYAAGVQTTKIRKSTPQSPVRQFPVRAPYRIRASYLRGATILFAVSREIKNYSVKAHGLLGVVWGPLPVGQ